MLKNQIKRLLLPNVDVQSTAFSIVFVLCPLKMEVFCWYVLPNGHFDSLINFHP